MQLLAPLIDWSISIEHWPIVRCTMYLCQGSFFLFSFSVLFYLLAGSSLCDWDDVEENVMLVRIVFL